MKGWFGFDCRYKAGMEASGGDRPMAETPSLMLMVISVTTIT